ncbi:MAG TPA: hypothetical protein VIK39_18815, partial [Candidatus Angelobacter sp.]
APKRKLTTSWKDFIRAHMAVLAATDFFTVEVLTLKGLMTYYVLFFIQSCAGRVRCGGRCTITKPITMKNEIIKAKTTCFFFRCGIDR